MVVQHFETSLSCLLPDDDTNETCLATTSLKARIILNSISLPDLAIIIRVTHIFSIVDDFTYFRYHKSYYGEKFTMFTSIMWNLTNEKFIPYSIAYTYYSLQDNMDAVTSTDANHVP